MDHPKKIIILLICMMSLSIILIGCGSENDLAKDQEITINLINQPTQIDPQISVDPSAITVLNAISEGLCRTDKNGVAGPGVAEWWDISKDGLVYIFHLRKSKWADGTEVKAQDFEYAWIRALNPAPYYPNPSSQANLLQDIKNAAEYAAGKVKKEEVGVKAQDDRTLVVTLNQPTPQFLDLVSNPIFAPLQKEFFDKNGFSASQMTKYGTDAAAILGNGPYKVKEWNHTDSLILEKNKNYWNKNAIKLTKITFLMINDLNIAANDLTAGKLDETSVYADKDWQKKLSVPIHHFDAAITVYIGFNNQDFILKNANIRKALAFSIDREKLINEVYKDNSIKALGFVSPAIYGREDFFRKEAGDLFKDNNVEEAKILLAKGLKELNLTQVPKLKILTEEGQLSKRDAEQYKNIWKQNLGIDVEIETIASEKMLKRVTKPDYQITMLVRGATYSDPAAFLEIFESQNPNNFVKYNNPNYDHLIGKARMEQDKVKRMTDLTEAEKMLINDMAICPVYFISRDYIIKSNVKGLIRRSSFVQDIDLYSTYIAK
jgi:oligopeptide transport system substrate-binding protein